MLTQPSIQIVTVIADSLMKQKNYNGMKTKNLVIIYFVIKKTFILNCDTTEKDIIFTNTCIFGVS